MTDINGRTAFITGGASGLGLSMAKAFAARGASVMLADINADGLAIAEDLLQKAGGDVGTVVCDVADVDSVRAAAQATVERFGKTHIVVNNAGVSLTGRAGKIAINNWRWVVDINLMGVVHGIEVFTPILRRQAEGGHFINTASMAGHAATPGAAPYIATKFAVVGYSEALRGELKPDEINVSVLCPAFVKTNILDSEFARPSITLTQEQAKQTDRYKAMQQLIDQGLDSDAVGQWVADCVESNRFYIFTHPELLQAIKGRFASIEADYQAIIDDGRFA